MTSESRRKSRARFLQVAAATWLLLVSAAAIVNHVALSRLAEDVRTSAQNIEVATLGSRLTQLEQQADAAQRQPAPLTEGRFVTVRQALEERLAKLEQPASAHAAATDIAHLRNRLDQLETRLPETRPAPAPAPAVAPERRGPPAETARPAIVEPPFRLLGIELRAGERFLSIAPTGSRSLAQVRVLRPGETEAGWQLESIEERTAVFRFEGQARQFTVP